jgi:hypothetical protein
VEIAEMTEYFKRHTVQDYGRFRTDKQIADTDHIESVDRIYRQHIGDKA